MDENNTAAENFFSKVVTDLRKGKTLTELSTDLQGLVKACRETGKAGSLLLKIKITPSGDGESVTVEDDVQTKSPKMNKAATMFYATDDNLLQRQDPRQRELALKVVENETPAEKAAVAQ